MRKTTSRSLTSPLLVSILLLPLLAAGCGGGSVGEEEKACLDMADVVAKASQRCGGDYKANYDAFIDAAAGGDCGNIKDVRDVDALYDECFPYIESVSCIDLVDASSYPAACVSQLYR
jgi:hypothetical protein